MKLYDNSKKDIENIMRIYDETISALNQVLVGQEKVKKILVSSILCDTNSRILLTGGTGMGKTTLSKFLAESFTHERISIVPDMIPSDVQEQLKNKKELGFLQIDEFNRASGRLQNTFIELFEENQMSINGENYRFNDFYVLATQNETDIAGTFNVSQAVYDRFDVNIYFDDLTKEDKRKILFGNSKPLAREYDLKTNVEITKRIVDNFEFDKQDEDIIMSMVDTIDNLNKDETKLFAGSNIRGHEFAKKLAKLTALADGKTNILPAHLIDLIDYLYMHRIDQNVARRTDTIVKEKFEEAKQNILDTKREKILRKQRKI